jgi:hypothetical protein
MRPIAKRHLVAGVLVALVSVMSSGCIVCIDDIFCDNRPPHMATLHVYVLDYYSGAPIPWAQVEVSESDWWSWDYIGTWSVGPSGYAVVRCGYLYPDGCGGDDEKDYKIVAYASGYCSERYTLELSYYYPSETLTFYLMPCWASEGGEDVPHSDLNGAGADEPGTPELSRGTVTVGEPGGAGVAPQGAEEQGSSVSTESD